MTTPDCLATMKVQELETCCKERGLPLTLQRRAVLEELAGRCDHPTADQVFEAVTARHPGISRTTVYRVLETLVQHGIARKVCNPGSTARFDADTRRHHHLVCVNCGAVIDFSSENLDTVTLPDEVEGGFAVHDYSVTATGLCADCRAAEATLHTHGRTTARPHSQRRTP